MRRGLQRIKNVNSNLNSADLAGVATPNDAQYPVMSECYGEFGDKRFPDPADSLPNPVCMLNFVHSALSAD
jgi:hypothetical protein